jgi:outer membrane protein OmpA-like peptidoglycan-associated protein
MKESFDTSLGGLVIIGLPLLLAAGCAANKAGLAQIDTQSPQVEEQVKTLLDQAAVPQTESIPSSNDQLDAAETTTENAAVTKQEVETAAPPPAETAAAPQEVSTASAEAEASASSPSGDAAVAEPASDAGQTPAKTLAAPPQQMILYFGFNQDEITPADQAIVKQHADFLLAHPEYTLLITGHTDNRGPKAYNQHLSEARADKVAQLLETDGVPKSQLHISAMGDTTPLVDPSDYRHNRRVEFIYQDAVMAKSP